MTIKLTPPTLTTTQAYIRKVGANTLPTGNTFWFEDVPQVPAITRKQKFAIDTTQIGKVHIITINNKEYKRFTPDTSPYYVPFVLNPGIYDYTIVCGEESAFGSFQVSIKEHFWQSWIRALEPTFQDLALIEGRFKNPINIVLLEITYPPEILKLSSSPYRLRNYFQSTHQTSLKKSFDWFASGLLNAAAIFTKTDYAFVDPQEDYSKLTLQFIHSTIGRRGFFLQKHDPDTILEASWNSAVIQDKPVYATVPRQSLNRLSSLTVRSNIEPKISGVPIKLFTLLNDSFKPIQDFVLDSPNHWKLKALTAGTYYVAVTSVDGYNVTPRVYVSLPPYSDMEIEVDYLAVRTEICVQLNEPMSWVLRGVNSSGLTTFLNGTGSKSFDITALFLAGYKQWLLDVDDTPAHLGPKNMLLLPDEGKVSCFFVYPKPTGASANMGVMQGYFYDKDKSKMDLPRVNASGSLLSGDPGLLDDLVGVDIQLPGVVNQTLIR
jgi:hypothetical protein